MKLRSAPLDDVYGELTYLLDSRGSHYTGQVVRLLYRGLRNLYLALVRREDRRRPFPELGHGPFNLMPEELAGARKETERKS
jgi:hypothetical protein